MTTAIVTGAGAKGPQSGDVFLRSARWLEPVSGELRGPVVVRISGGKIAGLINASELQRAPLEPFVDLGSATLLPGLIDAHVHLTIGGAANENAGAILRAGFTTVMDLGATSDAVLRLRDRISSGEIEGPRILGAGLWVGTKGGVCEFGGIGIGEAVVNAGISPIDAIRSATVNAARAFSLASGTGTIAPGVAADLIAVDGDPLSDASSFTRVVFVMRNGRIIRRPEK